MRLEIEAPSTGWIVVLTHRPFVRARMKKEREIAIGVMYHIIAQQVNNLITGFQTPNRENLGWYGFFVVLSKRGGIVAAPIYFF